MKLERVILIVFFVGIFLYSCENEKEDLDKEKPEIVMNESSSFPQNCDTLYFGESFSLKAVFKDNVALGSFSVNIHNNFDHHTHTTELANCNLSPKKEAKNPYLFTKDYLLDTELNSYEVNQNITIPSENDKGSLEAGDYHLFISLTDKSGWSAKKGLSVKILYRK